MIFTLKGMSLYSAIVQLQKVVGKVEFVYIQISGDKVYVSAQTEFYKAMRILDCKSNVDKLKFGMTTDILLGICNKRQELKFTYKEDVNELHFEDVSTGRYKGDIATLNYSSFEVVPKEILESKNTESVSEELKEVIFTYLPQVGLKSLLNVTLTVYVRCENGVLTMACSDPVHTAVFTREIADKKLKLSLDIPANYTELLTSFFGKETGNLSISSDDKSIYVWSEEALVSVPMKTPELTIPFEDIASLVSGFSAPTSLYKVNSEDIKNALGNIGSIKEDGKPLQMIPEEDGIKLNSKTKSGRIEDFVTALVAKKYDKVPTQFPMGVVADVVERLPEVTALKLMGLTCCVFDKKVKGCRQLFVISTAEDIKE